jgi:secreted PhoX family phosphatase
VALVGGRRAPLVRNAASGGELGGVTFSPDRRTLFVNIRDEGATCAIRGPFAQLGR